MFVYGIGCSFKGCGICVRDGAVNKRDGVLLNGMGCYFPGWDVR